MYLRLVDQPGGAVWVADAPDWTDSGHDHLNIGITPEAMQARGGRGQRWLLGQMYGVVGTGMIMAEHVFQGLKRRMYVRDDHDADTEKLAVTWTANRDAKLLGEHGDCALEFCAAPTGCVFVVYVSPNKMLEEFPAIHGWAEHWAWVAAEPNLPGAPVDWETRYDSRLWSRG